MSHPYMKSLFNHCPYSRSLAASESMKLPWLRIISLSLASNSISSSAKLCPGTHQLLPKSKLLHTLPQEPDTIVKTICDSLRKGLNWDAMNKRFRSVDLSNLIVEKVLLQLKEPADAKHALSFFHWSAQQQHLKHETSTYCIAIHILVRSKLIRDAQTLLESVMKKSGLGNSSSQFLVVDSLLRSYGSTDSIPLVFDLLVQTSAKLRMIEFSFDVCRYLDEHGRFSLSVISYNTLIDVVQKSDRSSLVWKIYEHMIQKRTFPNDATVRIMIRALCKEGKLQESVDMMDRIHGRGCSPTMIVNTSLVLKILEEGRVEEGILLLKRMLQKNMILDTISYSLIVCARVKLGSLDSGWEVYEEMLKRGFHANPFVYTLFIGAYCKEGRIEGAIHLMQEMENVGLKPYKETFDHLIVGCAQAGRLDESVKLCEKMMGMGFVPSCLAFNEMIGKLSQSAGVKKANEMLTDLLDKGFEPDGDTYSRLIAGYGQEGNIQEVLKLYYELKYRSLECELLVFESMVSCFCQCGKLDDAEKYLKVMKDESIPPSAFIYETLIGSHHKKGNISRAHQLNTEMAGEGLKPDKLFCCPGAADL
ncbi:hypothetical protein U1Q18_011356 [Sarracenia purpurea var. burkii]